MENPVDISLHEYYHYMSEACIQHAYKILIGSGAMKYSQIHNMIQGELRRAVKMLNNCRDKAVEPEMALRYAASVARGIPGLIDGVKFESLEDDRGTMERKVKKTAAAPIQPTQPDNIPSKPNTTKAK